MNGTQLWMRVKIAFRRANPKGAIHRIENAISRGMPDFIWCADGRVVWVELKGDGDKESPLQKCFRMEWHTAGGHAYVLSAAAGGFEVLDKRTKLWYASIDAAVAAMLRT